MTVVCLHFSGVSGSEMESMVKEVARVKLLLGVLNGLAWFVKYVYMFVYICYNLFTFLGW